LVGSREGCCHAISYRSSIQLTEGEREQLQSWSRRHTSAQALALRSQIVLAAAEGVSSSQVGRELGVTVDPK
jgi:DNA-binding CsgD family transcriptional regulator